MSITAVRIKALARIDNYFSVLHPTCLEIRRPGSRDGPRRCLPRAHDNHGPRRRP